MSARELLAREPNKTLSWLQQAPVPYSEFLRELFYSAEKVVATSKDTVEIFRAQGELQALGTLIELEASIRSYLHDVSTGKRKKIEEEQPNAVVQNQGRGRQTS